MRRQLLFYVLAASLFSFSVQAKTKSLQDPIQENLTLKNVLEHGLAQDGTDQSDELTTLLGNDVHLFFPKGIYHFTQKVQLGSVKNFIIEGEIGTQIITDKPILFEITGALKNVTFKNISIRSTDNTSSSFGQLSLIHSNEQNVTDLVFEDVFMTAPKSATNALKFINERNTLTKGVTLKRFKVDSIGRMGLEIQNHIRESKNAEVSRYEDILVIDSEFSNTGLCEYGMGVSVGGLGKNVQILNSSFSNSPNRAIEFIGTDGVIIEGNCFKDNFASIVITKNKIVTSHMTKNVVVSNNVAEGSEGEGFINVDKLSLESNIFRIQGRVKFENVHDAKINTLTIDTDAYAAITVGGLKNVVISKSSFKNKRSGNNMIRIEGESTDFKISDTDLTVGFRQIPYENLGNTFSVPEFSNVKVYDLEGKLVQTLNDD